MMRFSFKRGLRFFEGLASWTVNRRLETGKLQLEDEKGELRNMTEAEVMKKYVEGEFVVDAETLPSEGPVCHILVPRNLSDFPEKEQKEALRRQDYLKRLSDIGPIRFSSKHLKEMIAKVASDIGDPSPPSISSVYRWEKKFKFGTSVTSLLNKNENKGRRTTMTPEVLEIVDAAIEDVYLNTQKYSKKDVCERVQKNIKNLNKSRAAADWLAVPSRATLYRYFEKLYQYEVDIARLGKTAALARNRPSLKALTVKRIHERWEIDHTPLDFLVYCEETGLPMGRPWLTAILDRHSRYILGYYISFQHPSANSVLQAVVHAILPKEAFLAQFPDIQAKWLAKGFGDLIVCDNGMDFHAGSFIAACEEIGMSVWFCPAKTPQFKGAIERFFRTINHDLIHKFPGTVFNNPKARGEYKSEDFAAISFQTLNHLVAKWVVEVYHQTPHRSLRTTPHAKWLKGMETRLLEHPVHPDQLRIITGKTPNKDKKLHLYGIELDCLKYNSEELQNIRRRHGETIDMKIKYYEEDVGHIHVYDPQEKAYLKVEAVRLEYAKGLHRAQHRLICQYARSHEWDATNIDRLLEAKDELADIINKAVKSKRMIDRKRAAQARGTNSSTPANHFEQAGSQICASQKPNPDREDFGLDDDILDEDFSHLFVERDYFTRSNDHQEL